MKEKPKVKPLLVWGVPIELLREFKALCASQGVTMRDAVIVCLQAFVRGDVNYEFVRGEVEHRPLREADKSIC